MARRKYSRDALVGDELKQGLHVLDIRLIHVIERIGRGGKLLHSLHPGKWYERIKRIDRKSKSSS